MSRLRECETCGAPDSGAHEPRPADDGLMTSEEAARFLRTSVRGLHQLRYRYGGPPAVKFGSRNSRGGRLRFRRADLEAWLAKHVEQQEPA